ncbi:hypothetical protein MCUN1_002189 [Malassezia cuniculi]|uniref:Uncharacterized protein n=1 Tax=Malassezia cuniculi TaxID=948313 RepID=A0AAF0J6K9_9BASI|nr:hypothetical protein MCUN1_002189 [Malassezia cuniculi]
MTLHKNSPAREKYAEAKAARKARPPKKFAEQGGLEHMLALSQRVVAKKEQHFERLIAQGKATRESVAQRDRERKARKAAARKGDDTPTRADIVAQLKERQRHKTRERKEARKQRAEPETVPILQKRKQGASAEQPKKRVTFG